MQKYRFEFKSGYQGEQDYIVHDYEEKTEYRLHYRTSLNDYLERFYNGSKEQYNKEVVGSLHIAHRTCGKIKAEVVAAFKSYLQDQWNEYLCHCEKKLEVTPEYADFYTAGPATPIVYAGYWDNGWHKIPV